MLCVLWVRFVRFAFYVCAFCACSTYSACVWKYPGGGGGGGGGTCCAHTVHLHVCAQSHSHACAYVQPRSNQEQPAFEQPPEAWFPDELAQQLVDAYTAEPAKFSSIVKIRSANVYLPSTADEVMRGHDEWLYIVRTDARGETKNKTYVLEDPRTVSLKFWKGKLDKSKTLKTKPERLESAKHFVNYYTARETKSKRNPQVPPQTNCCRPIATTASCRRTTCSAHFQTIARLNSSVLTQFWYTGVRGQQD